ncbi:TerD family protein [Rhodococcus sp. YH1]|uniref:TerD family protein n=1 Tax=Rhodococcus sp. YH1 TaxID=89066 RepID=UPI0013874674|nr:hypothetical protein [Rhodococcus sp. YH1]
MTGRFAAGQNAPLTARRVRFTARAAGPLDVCALVVDTNLQVRTSADAVFYNQPAAPGVDLAGDAVVVDLDRVCPQAAAVLLAVSSDRGPVGALSTDLTGPPGSGPATFDAPAGGAESAVICWELYRRDGGWKLRAVGQGYAGGLAELFRAHGVDVDDEPAPPSPDTPATVPVEPEQAWERTWQIFEDASRSAAAFVSAHDYALHRLDEELSAAVSDPARRTGPAADQARAEANRRCDELIAAARARHAADTALLTEELRAVGAALPAAMASWDAPAWQRPGLGGNGLRIGELGAPDRDSPTLPLCLPLPLRRPLWVDGDSVATAPIVSALVVRLLAAHPAARLDVVDTAGALSALTDVVSFAVTGPVVRDVPDIGPRLRDVAHAVDLAALAVTADPGAEPPAPRIVVLAGIPHGYTRDDLRHVIRIVEASATQPVSVIIVGEDDGVTDEPLLDLLSQEAQHLPVAPGTHMADPWTGTDWQLTLDTAPDLDGLRRVVAVLGR